MFNFVHIALLAENIWCYVIIRTLLIVFLYFAICEIGILFYHPAIHTAPAAADIMEFVFTLSARSPEVRITITAVSLNLRDLF